MRRRNVFSGSGKQISEDHSQVFHDQLFPNPIVCRMMTSDINFKLSDVLAPTDAFGSIYICGNVFGRLVVCQICHKPMYEGKLAGPVHNGRSFRQLNDTSSFRYLRYGHTTFFVSGIYSMSISHFLLHKVQKSGLVYCGMESLLYFQDLSVQFTQITIWVPPVERLQKKSYIIVTMIQFWSLQAAAIGSSFCTLHRQFDSESRIPQPAFNVYRQHFTIHH